MRIDEGNCYRGNNCTNYTEKLQFATRKTREPFLHLHTTFMTRTNLNSLVHPSKKHYQWGYGLDEFVLDT